METRGRSKSVEISAKNVELAIEKGLAELGIGRDEAEITVIKQGSRGVLGIGAEDAVVRITAIPAEPEPAPKPVPRPEALPKREPVPQEPEKPKALAAEAEEEEEEQAPLPAPAPKAMPAPEPKAQAKAAAPEQSVQPPEEEPELKQAAKEVLQDLLRLMGVNARVEEADEISKLNSNPEDMVALNVAGDDLGILIGRRGETLRDLQFITRLIVSRKIQRWPNIVVDVEYYKARREKLLMDLAERMADRVRQNRRPVALEPMPAHERRIVHLTLRDDKDVITESTGEGQARKVVILPKP